MKNNYEVDDLLNYGYKIVQDKNKFKFSLDSVMLAEFINIDYTDKNILDLCTGNIPIPLILSNRNLEIYGIELQKSIFDMAEKTLKLNNISNISLINDNIKNWENYFPGNNFDIISCNPPYFKYNNDSIINKDYEKAIARHEIEISLEEIIIIAFKLLKSKGKLYLVHRPDRLIEIILLLTKHKFGIKKIQFVYYNKQKNSSIILIECKKDLKHDLKVLKPIFSER